MLWIVCFIIARSSLKDNRSSSKQQQQRNAGAGPVEYRKLLQRFRQFLAEEEKFWAKLIGRLYRTFVLEDARSVLQQLGILLEDEAGAPGQGHGRNQQQFPPEDPTPSLKAKNASEKEAYMSTLSKALVFLGDVARYRELYNEAGGRPRAGHEEGSPARKRNRRAPTWMDNISKARNYDKAQQYYEQARLLVPNEGKPSHQLAILASYKNDAYMSLAHYYRALCVKQSYDTALNNMNTLLSKTLDTWRTSTRHDKNRNLPLDIELHPGVRVEKFKERLAVLHALWRIGADSGVDKMNSIARKLDVAVANDFATLVGQRQMPADMITQAIAMSQGALWKHRMRRDTSKEQHGGSSTLLEWYIVKHLLDMHRALLEIGRDELNVPPSHDTRDDLGQQITATFRRTLPAMRVASKWLRANAKYLSQDPEFNAYLQKKKVATLTTLRSSGKSKLPKLTAPLEEDIELGGFLPLKKLMNSVRTDDQGKVKPQEGVHPNEEQLMRIADLHEDARAIAELDYAPIQFYSKSGVTVARQQELEERLVPIQQASPPIQTEPQLDVRTDQEDSLSDNSPDDDDEVVRNAFRHLDDANQAEDDDDGADRTCHIARHASCHISNANQPHITTPRPAVLPTTLETSPQSPTRTNGVPSRAALTTAEDLLKNVMGGGRPPPSQQPSHLFSANLSAQSIWSATSQDEQRMLAGTTSHTSGSPLFHSPTHQYSSLDVTHVRDIPNISQPSIWGPPLPYSASGFDGPQQQSIHANTVGIGLGRDNMESFAQQYPQPGLATTNGINGGRSNLSPHRRGPSITQQIQLQQQQQYQVQPPSSLPLLSSSMADPTFGLSMDGIGSSNFVGAMDPRGAFYNGTYRNGTSPFHTRHLSYNDPRLGPGMQQSLPPSLWGST
ncbi:hypothetical protein F5887DRAFT_1068400 [Amanita rubescens]|nr:hypothetical protein F5887DRAFT_1068400 [Amanita rubescens]